MTKEVETTEKIIRYKLKRNSSGVINPRSCIRFDYKGEVISIQKNLKYKSFCINIFKKGSNKNEGEFNSSQISLSEFELKELYNVIGELLDLKSL